MWWNTEMGWGISRLNKDELIFRPKTLYNEVETERKSENVLGIFFLPEHLWPTSPGIQKRK